MYSRNSLSCGQLTGAYIFKHPPENFLPDVSVNLYVHSLLSYYWIFFDALDLKWFSFNIFIGLISLDPLICIFLVIFFFIKNKKKHQTNWKPPPENFVLLLYIQMLFAVYHWMFGLSVLDWLGCLSLIVDKNQMVARSLQRLTCHFWSA